MAQTVRIKVRGSVNDRFATVFDGMTPVRGAGTTELVGPVADQAQLHGLLERIRDFGLELVSFEMSPVNSPPNKEDHDEARPVER